MRCETWASPSVDSAGPCGGRHAAVSGIVRGLGARWSHRIARARSAAGHRVPESPYARDRPHLTLCTSVCFPLDRGRYCVPWSRNWGWNASKVQCRWSRDGVDWMTLRTFWARSSILDRLHLGHPLPPLITPWIVGFHW